jgi:hypothetical protein
MTKGTVMKSPIWEVLQHWQHESWTNVKTQNKIRNQIIALGIDGLADVKFTSDNDPMFRQSTLTIVWSKG